MKKFMFFTMVVLVLTITPITSVTQDVSASTETEYYYGQPLCLPAIQDQAESECLVLGPAAGLTRLSKSGIFLPLRAIPAAAPDPTLVRMSENYARINLETTEPAPVYATIEDALANKPSRFIPPGRLRYVAYFQSTKTDIGRFVQLVSGEWMQASPAAYTSFQGLIFHQNPDISFGWILDITTSRTSPGYDAPFTKKDYVQYNIVQVYDVQTINKTEWAMIGLNEWVERRLVRVVEVNPLPPPSVTGDRWIEINLQEQTLCAYERGRLVFATLIASGVKPFYTRPGLFQIYKKKPLETMSGAFEPDRSDYYYLEDVPWTMYFDKERAIHGAYWRTLFGYPQSHGCVNMSPGDSNWLYAWAKETDWVYVWDPSGQTPTDPSLYGDGGA
jgi:hypothetical protein